MPLISYPTSSTEPVTTADAMPPHHLPLRG